MQFFTKESIAEIILVNNLDTRQECGCQNSVEARQRNGDWWFHTDDCYDISDLEEELDAILRLWDGSYARLRCLTTNPRDYNGGALWIRKTIEEVLEVDIDAAEIR